ncbi:MAG: hypothetical protein JNL44_00865 [Gemmatimonadetes bacterium]|nr:hypothetical protein [Gemmatimonadota bacterium]
MSTAADGSGAEPAAPQSYGDIVVVGGGCYGSYYVRQLHRGRDAGAIGWERLLVVDRDPDCAVATGSAAVDFVCRDWTLFFNEYLGRAAERGSGAVARDAIVPSPLMPHLMSHWVVARARARWPGRAIRLSSLEGALDVPWQRPGDDGTHYVSFATWMCPINCIEPRTCPHTRGPRAWSLPPTVRAFVETSRLQGRRIDGPAILHCVHRAYGVGMFGVDEVLAADALVASAAAGRAAEVLVGTVSHCHGALAVLALGELAVGGSKSVSKGAAERLRPLTHD